MSFEKGTPTRENLGKCKTTTVSIDHSNYIELKSILKSKRYNFSHFMDTMISVMLKKPEILDILLEE